jgi:hypothetical protein
VKLSPCKLVVIHTTSAVYFFLAIVANIVAEKCTTWGGSNIPFFDRAMDVAFKTLGHRVALPKRNLHDTGSSAEGARQQLLCVFAYTHSPISSEAHDAPDLPLRRRL